MMCAYLDDLAPLGLRYRKPGGGVYIWCRLPGNVDAKTVVAESAKRGISLIPGEVFFPYRNGGQNYIRLNYSYESPERIRLGMENLSQIIRNLAPAGKKEGNKEK